MQDIYGEIQGENLTPFIISQNTFRNTGSGGESGAVGLSLVNSFNNMVRGNVIDDVLGSSYYGIRNNNGVGNLSIYNNSITNLQRTGIRIYPMTGANRIYSNYLFNNGLANLVDAGGILDGNGIGIGSGGDGSSTLSIYNNTIDSSQQVGIGIFKNDIAPFISGNTVTNNKRGGIGIVEEQVESGEIVISGNLIHDNTNLSDNGKGGIGISVANGSFSIIDNDIYSNIGKKFGGLGFAVFNGTAAISGNNIYANIADTTPGVGGIGFRDLSDTASVRVENNTITDNSGWKIGGIGLINQSLITVDFNIFSNTIFNNAQSGIGIRMGEAFTIRNNWIVSNGWAHFMLGDEYYAAGIQIRDSRLTVESVVDNIIHSNWFAGIGIYNSGGIIGRSSGDANDIRFNGDPDDTSTALCDGVGGSSHGGISVRDLTQTLYVEDWSYIVTDNYPQNTQLKPGSGADFYYNGEKVKTGIANFWTPEKAVVYVEGDTTINCNGATIDATGKPFGIIILGDYNVTVKNCTIKNAATEKQYAVTAGNGTLLGAGIFIGPNATPYVSDNYIISNGWEPESNIDPTERCAGIMMRCNGAGTSIVNNIIASNRNEGITGRETAGFIGIAGMGNTFRNNHHTGIAMTGGGLLNLEIGHNVFHFNREGIGMRDLVRDNCTITNNLIFSNLSAGISLMGDSSPKIYGNEIYNHIYTCMGGVYPDCPGSQNPFGSAIRLFSDAQPSIGNNDIHDNSYAISLSLNPDNSYIFSGISLSNNGIGFHIGGETTATITNCTLYSNYRFGIAIDNEARPLVQNNIVRHNGDEAGPGGEGLRFMPGHGTGKGGIANSWDSHATIRNNTIWGHVKSDTIDNFGIGIRGNTKGMPDQTGMADNKVYLGNMASGNDYYTGRTITLLSGAGSPGEVSITNYNGVTKAATVSPAYISHPVQGDEFQLSPYRHTAKIHGNTIYGNFVGIAIGNRDNSYDNPNPEIFANTIFNNGGGDCPSGVGCGGGIGNRGRSTAVISQNTIYNHGSVKNAGISMMEEASPTVTNNNLIYDNYLGIGIQGDASPIITAGNRIYNNSRFGIAVSDYAAPTIDSNQIYSNGIMGIAIGDENPSVSDSPSPLVYANTIRGNGYARSSTDCNSFIECGGGIGVRYSGDVTISNNIIYDHSVEKNQGIGVEEAAAPFISDNIIKKNYRGIGIQSYSHPTISNNQIFSNEDTGIGIHDFAYPLIAYNDIFDNGGNDCTGGNDDGCQQDSYDEDCGGGIGNKGFSHAEIIGNDIYGHTAVDNWGIGIMDEAGPTISNSNVIHDNYRGIGVRGQAAPTISNNIIENNSHHGIGNRGCSSAYISENIIRDNGYDQDMHSGGIMVRKAAHPTIEKNQIYNNPTGGIACREVNETPIYIIANNIHGNGVSGLRMQEGAYVVLKNANKIFDNLYNGAGGIRLQGSAEIAAGNLDNDQSGLDNNAVRIDPGASGDDDYYNGMTLVMPGEDHNWQRIYDYDGTDKIAYITPAYRTHPVGGKQYSIKRRTYLVMQDGNEVFGNEGIDPEGTVLPAAISLRDGACLEMDGKIGDPNLVYNNVYRGIGATNNVLVKIYGGNEIYGNPDFGIAIANRGGDVDSHSYFVLDGNFIHDNSAGRTTIRQAIAAIPWIEDSKLTINIVGNKIYDNSDGGGIAVGGIEGDAVQPDGAPAAAPQIGGIGYIDGTISDNDINGMYIGNGIFLGEGSGGITVVRNVVRNNQYGISVWSSKCEVEEIGTGILPIQPDLPNNRIKLDANASNVDDYYNGMTLKTSYYSDPRWVRIYDYDSSTKTAHVTPEYYSPPKEETSYTIIDERSVTRIGDGTEENQNYVFNNSKAGIGVNDSSAIIDYNQIYNNGASKKWGDSGSGIRAQYSPYVRIRKNSIYGNGDSGIKVRYNSKLIIESNDIYDNANFGIGFERSSGIIVDNKVHDNGFTGISGDESQLTIVKSEIYNNDAAGIQGIFRVDYIIDRCKVYNNSSDGIRINGGQSKLGDFMTSQGPRPENRIRVSGGYSEIDNSIIYGNGDGGVSIVGGAVVEIYNSTVLYNTNQGIRVSPEGMTSYSGVMKRWWYTGNAPYGCDGRAGVYSSIARGNGAGDSFRSYGAIIIVPKVCNIEGCGATQIRNSIGDVCWHIGTGGRFNPKHFSWCSWCVNPLLTSDYHLSYGSPAIDVAIYGGGGWDYDGDPRDISNPDVGADEFYIRVALLSLSDEDGGNDPGYTNDRLIDVTVEASGHKGGMEIKISEYPDFSGSSWTGFQAETSYLLSNGDGEKFIYCKVRNSYGTSEVVKSGIVFWIFDIRIYPRDPGIPKKINIF